jgi:hypothetical protein
MGKYTEDPWADARMHAQKLDEALGECGWRHGSCHSDWDERGNEWCRLMGLTAQVIRGLDELGPPPIRLAASHPIPTQGLSRGSSLAA